MYALHSPFGSLHLQNGKDAPIDFPRITYILVLGIGFFSTGSTLNFCIFQISQSHRTKDIMGKFLFGRQFPTQRGCLRLGLFRPECQTVTLHGTVVYGFHFGILRVFVHKTAEGILTTRFSLILFIKKHSQNSPASCTNNPTMPDA